MGLGLSDHALGVNSLLEECTLLSVGPGISPASVLNRRWIIGGFSHQSFCGPDLEQEQ